MKRLFFPILFLFTIIDGVIPQTQVKKLLTENLTLPVGMDVSTPRFTWLLENNARNITQTAYEVEVKSDSVFVWRSGKVISDSSVHVTYKGIPLKSNTLYTWRVRVWDNTGQVSEWSSFSQFRTGFLHPSDWKAQWISPGFEEDTINRPSPYLRKTFQTKKEVRHAILYVTSHGMYEAYLNGKRVGDAHYTPGWTSYHKRLQYQTYDVTDLLQHNNAIAVMLASGWYRGTLGWSDKNNHYGNDIALLLQLEIEYIDSTRERVISDTSWRSTTGKITYSEIYNGEKIDLRLEKEGWMLPQYDDSQWHDVKTLNFGTANLVGTYNEPVRQQEIFKPVRIFNTPKGEHIIDFDQNLAGWVRMKVKGKSGDMITLSHGEVLDSKGNFHTANLRKAKAQCIYILRDTNEIVLYPHFTWHGFRYLKIENYPGEIKQENFEAVALYSDMEQTGSFSSSLPLINQLQSNIEWGQKGNFLDIPTDCPQRDERLGWTGDIQIFAPTATFNMRVHNFLTKWLRDLEADQLPTGEVPNYIPDLGSNVNRAAWGDASTIIPWTLYKVYGDKRILGQQYNSMKAYIKSITDTTNEGLWDKGLTFGDWLAYSPEEREKKTPNTNKYIITQAYYAYSLRIMMNTAKVLDITEDEIYYANLLEQAIKAFHTAFINEKGDLISQSQTAYSIALEFGMIPHRLEKQAAARLVELINDFGHFTTGFLATSSLPHILLKYGYGDLAYELLEREEYPSWLYPITMGATTFWERWNAIKPDGNFQTQKPQSNSFNHYAHGAIGDFLYRKVAGLNMASGEDAVGYKHILIKPYPGGRLKHACATLETYYGKVASGWQLNDNQMTITVEIPVNTQATVYLPSTKLKNITEGGKSIELITGLTILRQEENQYTVIQIGSGKYQFNIYH